MPFDLDSIEETMNRRMRTIWLRYATFLSVLGFIAVVGLVALTVYLTTKATVMKMAVGPKGSGMSSSSKSWPKSSAASAPRSAFSR